MRIGLLAPANTVTRACLTSSNRWLQDTGGNLGNMAFVEALARHLGPQGEIAPWNVDAEEAREKYDLIVLAAANQLGPHNDLSDFAGRLEKIGRPIVVVGLGAQAPDLASPVAMTPSAERWARVLASHAPTSAPNIGVRGAYSARALESLGLGSHAVVTGCPSNFLNDDPRFYRALADNVARRGADRLGVAGGNRHFAAPQAFERRLVQLVDETRGAYVVQAPVEALALARGELHDGAEIEAWREYLAPALSREAFLLWARRHATAFADAASWMEAMRGFDFVVGARFHGVMLAIQAGTPGGVFAHDSRTLELCRTMAIPVRDTTNFPAKFGFADLHRLFSWDVARFAATREALRQTYCDLLRGCGIAPSARLTTAQSYAPNATPARLKIAPTLAA